MVYTPGKCTGGRRESRSGSLTRRGVGAPVIRALLPVSRAGGAMPDFVKFVLAPAGFRGAALAISGSRAGGVGVLNGELTVELAPILRELDVLASHAGPLRPEAGPPRDGGRRRTRAVREPRPGMADPRPRRPVVRHGRDRGGAAGRGQGAGRGAHARRGRCAWISSMVCCSRATKPGASSARTAASSCCRSGSAAPVCRSTCAAA